MGNTPSAPAGPQQPQADPELAPKIPYSKTDRILHGAAITFTAVYAWVAVLCGSVLGIETHNVVAQGILKVGNFVSLGLIASLWLLGVSACIGLAPKGKKAWFSFWCYMIVLGLALLAHILTGVFRNHHLEYTDKTGGA